MSIRELNDRDLLARLKDLHANQDAYAEVIEQYCEEIYNRYYHQAYNLSRYYGLSRHDAEDVVQESFIKLFKNINTFQVDREFKPWFFKIILNSVRDRYKDIKKYKYKDIDNLNETSNFKHEEILEEFHIKDHLNSIINTMPEKLKSVLVLRVYADMDFELISDTLNVSVRQLHNRLNKAYEFVKRAVEDQK